MKSFFVACLIFALAGFSAPARAAERRRVRPSPLRLDIVPSQSVGGKKILGRTLAQSPEAAKYGRITLDVVLTNTSSVPVKVWEPFCLWGCRCLSFEVIRDGRRRKIERPPRAWDSNWPRPFTIAPQEHYVFQVTFGDGTWPVDWIPTDQEENTVVTLRAIYTIPPPDEIAARKAPDIRVGTVSCTPAEFVIP